MTVEKTDNKLIQRVRGAVDYSSIDSWDTFKERHPKEAKELGRSNHNKIIATANQNIADILLNDAWGFKLPERMGWLHIIKYIPKKRTVSPQLSRDYDKKIVFINSHSYGYSYKFYWSKKMRGVKNITLYTFKACRTLKRTLAARIFAKKDIYFEKPLI